MTQEKLNNGAIEVKDAQQAPAAPQTQLSMYLQAKAIVEEMVPWDKFKKGTAGSGLSIFDNGGGRGTRLLKVVESKKGLRVEFNVDVEAKLKELAPTECTIYTVKEAKEKHMGTCRWIYTGSSLEVLRTLVAQAIAGFAPKVVETKKEEPKPVEGETKPAEGETKPAEAKAPEAPKQPEKQPEPVKATRNLSKEEKSKMEDMKKQLKEQEGRKLAQ